MNSDGTAANYAIATQVYPASPASSAAVPEIDGSVAPKVAILLCGLFLLFGRQKRMRPGSK